VAADSDAPELLTSCANEAEAALLVAALEARGVEARPLGALTSGFRAEAPGGVQIFVRRSDIQRARQTLAEIEGPDARDDD